jgi:hypothetical protein
MSKTAIRFSKKPKLKKPVLIEGLPGMGYVGKLAAEHLVEELNAKKFAELRSPYFPHHVHMEPGGVLRLVRDEFYQTNVDGRGMIMLVGDVQATSPEGHYEVTNKILDLAEELKVRQIFTLGGYATGRYSRAKPRVIGAVNDDEFIEIFRKHGVKIEKSAGPIIGISGLLLGLGRLRGIKGACLLGETHGMLVDHRSAQSVLETLANILGIKVDMRRLEQRAKNTEHLISRIRKEQKLRERRAKRQEEEGVSYIG